MERKCMPAGKWVCGTIFCLTVITILACEEENATDSADARLTAYATHILKGTVVDDVTNAPLSEHIRIVIEPEGVAHQDTLKQVNEDGTFRFQYDWASASNYFVTAEDSTELYKKKTAEVTIRMEDCMNPEGWYMGRAEKAIVLKMEKGKNS